MKPVIKETVKWILLLPVALVMLLAGIRQLANFYWFSEGYFFTGEDKKLLIADFILYSARPIAIICVCLAIIFVTIHFSKTKA